MAPVTCVLCERPLSAAVEWHHLVPKSEGGRETAPVHPICHRTIHANASNAELARIGDDLATLRALPGVARFVAWVKSKEPDFLGSRQAKMLTAGECLEYVTLLVSQR